MADIDTIVRSLSEAGGLRQGGMAVGGRERKEGREGELTASCFRVTLDSRPQDPHPGPVTRLGDERASQ